MASAATLRRLMKEYQNEQEQQEQLEQQASSSSSRRKLAARDENVLHLSPKDPELQDLLKWQATIQGPRGGYYEGESLFLPHIDVWGERVEVRI